MEKKITTEQVAKDAVQVVKEMQDGQNPQDARNPDFDPTVRAATAAYFEARVADAAYSEANKAVATAAGSAARSAAVEASSKAFAVREAAKRAYSAHLK